MNKNFSLLLVLIAVFFSSCDDGMGNKFVGKWVYSNYYGLYSKMLTITKDGSTYNIEMNVTTISSDKYYYTTATLKGENLMVQDNEYFKNDIYFLKGNILNTGKDVFKKVPKNYKKIK